MASASSAALQQILQRAQAVFPERSMAPDNAVEVSARPAGQQTPVRPAPQSVAEWEQEANALLSDGGNTPGAAEVWRRGRYDQPHYIDNPFPGQFPGSTWVRIDRPQGQGWYYEGHMRRGCDSFCITAVPGEYRSVPPRYLQGFGKYIPSRSGGGCWVRIQKE